MLHVHEMQRRATGPNHLEVDLVGRVVETAKLSVVDAESILPNVKHTLLSWSIARPSSAQRIRDASTFDTITTQGHTRAAEA